MVEFMWVPGHAGMAGNDAADRVARAVGGLPFRIRYDLPFCDLFDPVGCDFESWVRLLWPYLGMGVPPARDTFGGLHISLSDLGPRP